MMRKVKFIFLNDKHILHNASRTPLAKCDSSYAPSCGVHAPCPEWPDEGPIDIRGPIRSHEAHYTPLELSLEGGCDIRKKMLIFE